MHPGREATRPAQSEREPGTNVPRRANGRPLSENSFRGFES